MTLLGAILKKVRSTESVSRKYASPPPEVEKVVTSKRKQYVDKYAHVRAKVDASGPHYAPGMHRAMLASVITFNALRAENVRLLIAIRKAHFQGRVDNRWDTLPPGTTQYYEKRANFLKHTQLVNRQIYKRLASTGPRVVTTANLRRDWTFNRNEMLRRAQGKFVLFPPVPTEHVEDVAFLPPAGVKRPRINCVVGGIEIHSYIANSQGIDVCTDPVITPWTLHFAVAENTAQRMVHLTVRTRGYAVLGELVVELFTDVCPNTCSLFLELVDGDEFGYGYVGTRFFRKVPGLFWSGGDVIYDNGFGCYAQRGRVRPVGAQNFHFPHSMPGLLSMRVTKDDEMCGIFNITFKPLPQFDLRNEVFGRVVRPCATYDSIQSVGAPLSDHPTVELAAARRRALGRWHHGIPNTRLITNFHLRNKK